MNFGDTRLAEFWCFPTPMSSVGKHQNSFLRLFLDLVQGTALLLNVQLLTMKLIRLTRKFNIS